MSNTPIPIAIIGAGPAGLMAAEVLSAAGICVHVYDAMPSVGRKFLLAGIGGLNLTHAEPFDVFTTRFGERATACANWLQGFDAQAIREWAKGLGIDTFVGSSQRVFPTDMKAAPLLRAWLHRLRHPQQGEPVRFHMRHRWNGNITRTDTSNTPTWQLEFDTPHGVQSFHAHAVLMALGGGSWARLGSDGAWQSWLRALQIEVAPLVPANCGFDISVGSRTGWSEHLRTKFAGTPLKSVVLSSTDAQGHRFSRKGEMVITEHGIEGSLVYAASALLRNEIARSGSAHLHLNLRPDFSAEHVLAEVRHPRGSRSLSSHLKSRLNLQAVHLALLHEVLSKDALSDPVQLAQAIQHLPITLVATRPLDEAISSAGGVKLEVLDDSLMSRHTPGLFAAGEMLDWEAPTGGYLLSACLASGRHAANGALAYLHLNSRATTSL
ncbi:MAG: hypothetical protein RL203_150 [Pseudomonadota bacterium]